MEPSWPAPHGGPGPTTSCPRRSIGSKPLRDPTSWSLAPSSLRAAHEVLRNADGERPDYHLLLPPDWHDRPDVVAAAEFRMAAAADAGLRLFVERLSYRYLPKADGLPPRSERLVFLSRR